MASRDGEEPNVVVDIIQPGRSDVANTSNNGSPSHLGYLSEDDSSYVGTDNAAGDTDRTPLLHSSLAWRLPRSLSGYGYTNFEACAGPDTPGRNHRTLGGFMGVFTPVALSMFSTMLFLRPGKLR